MSSCNIDHAVSEVQKKLSEQKPYLPAKLVEGVEERLSGDVPQASLNEIFHLLKKYDLASDADREDREQKLVTYV